MAAVAWSGVASLRAEVTSTTRGGEVLLQNQFVTVQYHIRTGRMDVVWRDGHKLLGLESGVQLADGRSLSTSAYSAHALRKQANGDQKSAAGEFILSSPSAGEPERRLCSSLLWMNDQRLWIAIEVELDHDGSAIGTIHRVP